MDDQAHFRIHMETEAILGVLAWCEGGNAELLSSVALNYGNYSAFSRKVLDCTVISTNGRNLERWRMNRGLRFLAALGMTKDAE
jgi:hypothetical protein